MPADVRARVLPNLCRMAAEADLEGGQILDLHAYRAVWNDSFEFSIVDPRDLSPFEAAVYQLTRPTVVLANLDLSAICVDEILISETMRLSESGDPTLGLYEPDNRRIIIRRDQLASAVSYCGTLLHELTHAASGATDASMEFETALTE